MPVPNTFQPETRIESGKVNENFDYLDDSILDHESRILTLESIPGGGSSVFITPQDYGAIGNGASHPLSSVYANLAAAQVVYSFATALTQEIDYCAFKKMCLTALGAEGAEHADVNAHLNKPMWIPAGNYLFGDDTLTIRNTSGMKMWGAGKRATKIYSNNCVMAFDGLWYSDMRDMSIICLTNTAGRAFDIDGNVPGHPYATRGSQGNKFTNMLFDGAFSDYVVQMNRQGIGSAQGSENKFDDCHFQSGALALYWQTGNNALNNTFIGGNFQGYNKDGIHLEAGHINVYSVGFQSTTQYTQIANDGWDINAQGSGVTDKISIQGCRTESLRFLKATGSTPVDVRTITHNPSLYIWGALAPVALDTVILKLAVDGTYRLYRVTTAGNSGAVEPVWPNTGAIADGSAVWTVTDYDYINIQSGSIDRPTCHSPYLSSSSAKIKNETNFNEIEVSTNTVLAPEVNLVLVDASAGPVTITLPIESDNYRANVGKEITIKKMDTSANAVTVDVEGFSSVDFAVGSANIPGGSRGWVKIMCLGGGALARRWFVTSKNFSSPATPTQHEGNADYVAVETDTYIMIDTTAGDKTVTLPQTFTTGKEITIIKFSNDANKLFVAAPDTPGFVVGCADLAGGNRGSVKMVLTGNGGLTGPRWMPVGKMSW